MPFPMFPSSFPAILNSIPLLSPFWGSRTLSSRPSQQTQKTDPRFPYGEPVSRLAESRYFLQLALDDRNQQQRSWGDTPPVAPPQTLADCPLHGGQPLVVVAGVFEPSTRHVVGRIGPRGRRPRAPGEFFKEREAMCWPSPRRGALAPLSPLSAPCWRHGGGRGISSRPEPVRAA